MTTTNPTNIVVYIRLSTGKGKDRKANELGIESQKEECKRWISENSLSHLPIEYFVDEGVSGNINPTKREGFTEALNKVKKGTIFLVKCEDRLARGASLSGHAQTLIEEKGGKLMSTQDEGLGDNDLTSTVKLLLVRMKAQQERKDLIDRTKRAMKTRREKLMKTSRYPPFGWDEGEKDVRTDEHGRTQQNVSLVRNEREQAAIKLIHRRRDEGDSYQTICNEINKSGLKTKVGKPFTQQAIRKIAIRQLGQIYKVE